MSAAIRSSIALVLLASAGVAQAQQQHQHHQQGNDTPAAIEQGKHEHQSPAPKEQGEHAHHSEAPKGQSEHAHHSSPAGQPSDERTESERAHIPPPPPEHAMGDVPEEEMAEMMGMDDAESYGLMLFDQLEWRDTGEGDALAWDGRAFYGNDYDKALLKTEGERLDNEYEGSAELLWEHVISRWWSLQAGVAHDFGEGPSRTWAAFGVQGLAPYWFEVEALMYVGEEGRTAASFSAEYEMFLTQRLVLQPKFELDLYGKDDVANGIGSGLSDAELGLRLRYEIRREFAPYVGVLWSRKFGETSDLARDHGGDAEEVQFVAGLRTWF